MDLSFDSVTLKIGRETYNFPLGDKTGDDGMTENNGGSSVGSVTVWPTTTGLAVTWPQQSANGAPVTFSPMPYPAAYAPAEVEEPGEVEDPEVEDPEDEMVEQAWEGILGFEGVPTDDGRYLVPGTISERELPLTLMVQTVTAEGHEDAFVGGRIDRIWRMAMPTIGPKAVAVMGSGIFNADEDGCRAASLVGNQSLRGVSFDLSPGGVVPIDAQTLEPMDESEVTADDVMAGRVLIGMTDRKIMGATVCPFPAFAGAFVRLRTDGGAMVASAHAITLTEPVEALTASAAGIAPLAPPRDWFFTPETDGPCPLTVTADGRVYGHMATWDQCHTGFPNSCQLAPRSPSNYRSFHLGAILTDEGEQVPVGRITVGRKGHAPIGLDMNGAIEHYDRTGNVAAFVRATDGRHGIWLSGAIRSDAPAELVRDLRANPPSGDWRAENGSLEMCAVLSVTKPGFPVPRAEYAMVASAGGEEEVTALVAMLPVEPPEPMTPREAARRRGVLTMRLRQSLSKAEPPAAA